MSSFKVLTFPCTFSGGVIQHINFYIGSPAAGSHPICFQMKWLSGNGGNVPSNIVAALAKLNELAKQYNIPFIYLCEYVIVKLSQ